MLHVCPPLRLDAAIHTRCFRVAPGVLLAILFSGLACGQDSSSYPLPGSSFPLGLSDQVIGGGIQNDDRVIHDGIEAVIQSDVSAPAEPAEPRIARRTPESSDIEIAASERQKLLDDVDGSIRQLQAQSGVLRKIVQATRPSVVHVIADKRHSFDPANLTGDASQESTDAFVEEAGAGVIIQLDGKPYVLTNRHVIHGAELDKIRVSLDNRRTLKPTHAWSDESTDVAVLEIAETNVLPARIGNSDDLEIGDLVLAIGSPFGLNHSVTHGIISAKGRRDLFLGSEKVRIQDFLQTDAPINPGNSGGPLINVLGEVIGINTAIASNSGGNEGIGFAIPINISIHVARQLVQNGRFAQVYLGVKLDRDFEPVDAQALGLPSLIGTRVTDVADGSPAAHAKLRRGDVIVAFNGVNVESDSHLVKLVGLSAVGSEVCLQVFRDGRFETALVRIEEKRAK